MLLSKVHSVWKKLGHKEFSKAAASLQAEPDACAAFFLQVIQIQAQDAPRSRMPRLLKKFSTRKKEK